MKKNNYKKENCTSKVRATIHVNNIIISLMGTHGCNWSICVEEPNKHIIRINEFDNRLEAKAEFDKTKELYMPSSVRRKIR